MRFVERYGRRILVAEAALVYLFLYVPVVVLVALSFNSSRFVMIWKGFTIHWYRQLFAGQTFAGIDPDTAFRAISTSLEIALVSVVLSTIFGTMLAFALDRYEFPGKSLLRGVVYLPIVIPAIVTGISMLLFFNILGMTLGIKTAMIAHVMFNISFVTILVFARLQSFDRGLEEAAKDLGAGSLETFRYVTLPLIRPGILAGMLLAFSMSFDDFVITFFVVGNNNTLPIYFFSMIRQGVTPGVNVIATIVMLSTMVLVAVASRFQKVY